MAGTARVCRAGVPMQSPARGAPDPAPHNGAALLPVSEVVNPHRAQPLLSQDLRQQACAQPVGTNQHAASTTQGLKFKSTSCLPSYRADLTVTHRKRVMPECVLAMRRSITRCEFSSNRAHLRRADSAVLLRRPGQRLPVRPWWAIAADAGDVRRCQARANYTAALSPVSGGMHAVAS